MHECVRQVPPMATARAYPAVAAASEHLLVAGGDTQPVGGHLRGCSGHNPMGGEYFASVEVYNGTTQVRLFTAIIWAACKSVPPRSGMELASGTSISTLSICCCLPQRRVLGSGGATSWEKDR